MTAYTGKAFGMGRDNAFVDLLVPGTNKYYAFLTCDNVYGGRLGFLDDRTRLVWQRLPGWYGRRAVGELFTYDEEG